MQRYDSVTKSKYFVPATIIVLFIALVTVTVFLIVETGKDTKYSEWSDWSACKDGKQSRTRSTVGTGDTDVLPADLIQHQECHPAKYGEWTYTACDEKNECTATRQLEVASSGAGFTEAAPQETRTFKCMDDKLSSTYGQADGEDPQTCEVYAGVNYEPEASVETVSSTDVVALAACRSIKCPPGTKITFGTVVGTAPGLKLETGSPFVEYVTQSSIPDVHSLLNSLHPHELRKLGLQTEFEQAMFGSSSQGNDISILGVKFSIPNPPLANGSIGDYVVAETNQGESVVLLREGQLITLVASDGTIPNNNIWLSRDTFARFLVLDDTTNVIKKSPPVLLPLTSEQPIDLMEVVKAQSKSFQEDMCYDSEGHTFNPNVICRVEFAYV